MELKERHNKIIESLGTIDGRRFTDLQKDTQIDQDTLSKALKELVNENLITQPKKHGRYFIDIEIKNKTIKRLDEKYKIMNFDLDVCMSELSTSKTPFEIGKMLIQYARYDLEKLSLDKYARNLSSLEKNKIEKVIKRCNEAIERTFNELYKISEDQTMALHRALEISRFNPKKDLAFAGLSNPQQKRKANKIIRQLEPTFPEIKNLVFFDNQK